MFESILKHFYKDNIEKYDAMPDMEKGKIIMSLAQAIEFSKVPESEWKRLIKEKKVRTHNYDEDNIHNTYVWYVNVKNIKYWWERHQAERK